MILHSKRWNLASVAAPKIVLLHGMGGTGSLWRPIAAALEDKIDVLALDQRGHGQSQIPASQPSADYGPKSYGRDVIETLDHLGFHPTWLLGHSMGVRSAVAAAHQRPEWIKGLVLIDLGFSGMAGGGLGNNLAQFLKRVPPRFASRQAARDFMNEHCPDPAIGQYLMAVLVKSPEASGAGNMNGATDAESPMPSNDAKDSRDSKNSKEHYFFPFDQKALIQTIETAGTTTVRDSLLDLAQHQMPVLVLRGQKSLVWAKEEYEKERQFFKDCSSLEFSEIPNAGHGLPFEQRQI